jgi:hypothetical protein
LLSMFFSEYPWAVEVFDGKDRPRVRVGMTMSADDENGETYLLRT